MLTGHNVKHFFNISRKDIAFFHPDLPLNYKYIMNSISSDEGRIILNIYPHKLNKLPDLDFKFTKRLLNSTKWIPANEQTNSWLPEDMRVDLSTYEKGLRKIKQVFSKEQVLLDIR